MHVEFFGVPRQRAGLSGLEMNAETLGHLLTTLAARIPSFGKFISTDGQGSRLCIPHSSRT